MKKLIIFLLAIVLATPLYAFEIGLNTGAKSKVMVYQVVNSSTTTDQTHAVSTSLIIPGTHKILGVTITKYNLASGSEYRYGLWDKTTGATIDEVIDENEALGDNGKTTWYYYPLSVETQLKVNQGPNTIVLVYYSK